MAYLKYVLSHRLHLFDFSQLYIFKCYLNWIAWDDALPSYSLHEALSATTDTNCIISSAVLYFLIISEIQHGRKWLKGLKFLAFLPKSFQTFAFTLSQCNLGQKQIDLSFFLFPMEMHLWSHQTLLKQQKYQGCTQSNVLLVYWNLIVKVYWCICVFVF